MRNILMPGISIAEVEFRMLSSVHFTNADGIGSFLGELFRKILPYLNKSARIVRKEVLHAGINVTEDVKNNKPLKEAVKSWLDNLKTKEKNKFPDEGVWIYNIGEIRGTSISTRWSR